MGRRRRAIPGILDLLPARVTRSARLFSRFVKIHFEGDQLANARAHSIARDGGDMNEQLLDGGARLDEAETTLVAPFDQCSVHSHQQSTQVRGDWLQSRTISIIRVLSR